jgi:hypothetical protein
MFMVRLCGAALAVLIFSLTPWMFTYADSEGQAYYLDNASGSDSNSGRSPGAPWRTIGKVNSIALAPGDTVYLKRGGIWRETLDPKIGGAPGRPITFAAYGSGPQPTISGSDPVRGWKAADKPVYRAYSAKPGNVYVDGGPGWGLAHACCAQNRSCSRAPTCSIGPMTTGSWYWDDATSELFVWLPDNSSPAGHTIEAAVRTYGMKAVGDAGEKGNLVVDGLKFERTGGYGIYFFSNGEGGAGPSGVVIQNTTVRQTGTGRIDNGEYYNAIHFSEHIELATAPRFINNSIAYSGGHGNAINSQNAGGAQIIGNRAEHFNHSGFDTKDSASVVIRGNVAHDAEEANGIYQENCPYGIIERNQIYNLTGSTPGRGSGIQIEPNSPGTIIRHNSIFNVVTGIYLNAPATAQHNAVSKASSTVLEANAGGVFDHNLWGLSPTFSMNGKLYLFHQWRMMPHHGEEVAADPTWVDPGRGNFVPMPSSPCRELNAGAVLGTASLSIHN